MGATDLLLVRLELRSRCMLQGNRKGTNLVVVGAALQTGKHCEIDALLEVIHSSRRLALGKPVGRLGALQQSGRHAVNNTVQWQHI